MASSIIQFPVEELLSCLRNELTSSDKFVRQAHSQNSAWIYEIIKLCHNTIFEAKELPTTKLNALLMIKDLMQTCEVPCLNLVEVYILPIVYKIAIEKPQEKGERRGSTFFQYNGKSPRIPNVQEIGIKFLALCSEILYAGSIIKPYRNFQSQELDQKSQYFDYFEKFKKYGISGTPNSMSQLKNFSQIFKQKGRQKYVQSLKSFYKNKNDYAEYFVTKILDSVQTDNNPLLNANQVVSSVSNDLDMRKLLKHGDTFITSPLIQQLLLRLKTQQSFMVKKNALSLLTDFIKWGDAEAFAKLCYDSSLQKVGRRVAEIDGHKGLAEGQNIYPQVKGQRDGKRKFYAQYLKSLELITNCLDNQKLQIEEAQKIKDLYDYLKKQKKFQFPQNLMAKRIQTEFHQNLAINQARNFLILKKMREEGGGKQRKQKLAGSVQSPDINKNFQDCLQQIVKLPISQSQIDARMTKIQTLKGKYGDQIERLAQNSQIEQQDLEQLLDNQQQLNKIIERLQSIHKNYKTRAIDFEQFKTLHASLTKDFQIEEIFSQNLKSEKSPRSNFHLKQSQQEVVNSFNLNNNNPGTALKISLDTRKEQVSPQNALSSSNKFQKNNNTMQHNNIKIMNGLTLSENQLDPNANEKVNKLMIRTVDAAFLLNNNVAPKLLQPALIQNHKVQIPQQQVHHAISSIVSHKSKSSQQSKKMSNIVNSSVVSQTSVLKNRVQARRQQLQSKIKSAIQSQISSKHNQQNNNNINTIPAANTVMNGVKNEFKIPSQIESKIESNNSHAQYVEYIAPPSFKIPKINEANQNNTAQNGLNQMKMSENKFSATAPNLNQKQLIKLNQQKPKTNQYGIGETNKRSVIRHPTFDASNQGQQQFINPTQLNKLKQQANNVPKQLNNSGIKNSTAPKIISSKGFSGSKVRQPEYQTQYKSNNDNRLYNMYRQQKKMTYNPNRIPTFDYEGNKENPRQNISKNIQIEHISSKGESQRNHFQDGDSFHTCKGSAHQSSNKQKKFLPFNSVNHTKNFDLPSNKYEMKLKESVSSYHSIKNGQFIQKSVSISRNMNYNYMAAADEDDQIRQPQYSPMENSYYGVQDLQNKLKNGRKANFKDCFQINEQIVSPMPYSNFEDLINFGSSRQKGSRSNESSNIKFNQHEQYLLTKLKRQYDMQPHGSTKQLNNRVMDLKLANLKLRNQVMKKDSSQNSQRMSSKQSRSSSSSVVSFTRSQNGNATTNTNRFMNGTSQVSAVSSVVVKGQQINESMYKRYFNELDNLKLKKACIRNKSVIFQNEICQIGCLFKQRPTQPVNTVSIYFTPKATVRNFQYSITKQPQLQIESFGKQYDQIPENKQIKIEVICKLNRAIPYNLPIMSMNFYKGRQQKDISFYLPITFNKFLHSTIEDQSYFQYMLRQNNERILKTTQFNLNSKIAKLSNITQTFPTIVQLSLNNHNQSKYALKYDFGIETIIVIITIKGKQKVVLQGFPLNPGFRQPTEHFLLNLKHLLQA